MTMPVLKTLILGLLLLVPGAAYAGSGPRITFDKNDHDYGKVRYGQTVTEEFTFTNTGDEKLVIEQLRSSCGCTKAVQGSSEIPAGGKSKIVASFDTTDLKPGMKQKMIYVHSNDPEKPVVKLVLIADVVKEVNISPPSLAKKLAGFAETVTFPVKISNTSDVEVAVKGLQVNAADVTAELEPHRVQVKPHGNGTFDVVLKLEKDPARHFYMGRLMVLTDHPKEKQIELGYLIQLDQPK
jgi:hypothetical protein